MKVPIMDKFCCYCSLKNGTIIIGVIELLWYILIIIWNICDIISLESVDDYESFIIETTLELFYGFLGILVNVLLIVGARREVPQYLLIWIIVTLVNTIILTLYTFTQGIVSIALRISKKNTETGIIEIIISVILLAISIYELIIVYNYKKEIYQEKEVA